MKMGERCPARVLPRGLVLTFFSLVSLHVSNTSVQRNPSSQPKQVLPGNMEPSNFSSSSTPSNPPTTADFIMECQSPAGDIWDHCWLDDNTLFIVHRDAKKVVKATINRQTKTCTYTYYSENPPAPSRVACSSDGDEIYVVSEGYHSVWVYDRKKLKAVWNPEGLVGTPYTVAVSSHRVVLSQGSKGPLYVYNRNRVYLGQISISQNQFMFAFSHLIKEDLFVGTEEGTSGRFVIHDIPRWSTIIVGGPGSENGRFNRPYGVSTVGDYILVSDFGNDRVSVFSQYGGFRSNLQFSATDVSRPTSIGYRPETKFLVVTSYLHSYIKIFSLLT